MAIMRLWRGEVSIEKADEYEKFMIEKAAPDYGSVDGLLKMYFQRRNENTTAHFPLVTIWDSLESLKKSAGAEHEPAKYYPEDDNFLGSVPRLRTELSRRFATGGQMTDDR